MALWSRQCGGNADAIRWFTRQWFVPVNQLIWTEPCWSRKHLPCLYGWKDLMWTEQILLYNLMGWGQRGTSVHPSVPPGWTGEAGADQTQHIQLCFLILMSTSTAGGLLPELCNTSETLAPHVVFSLPPLIFFFYTWGCPHCCQQKSQIQSNKKLSENNVARS